MTATSIEKSYSLAKERYAEWDVDLDAAIKHLEGIAISVQCWQGDDVAGFESAGGLSGGGIMATGNYPGRARNADELRADAAEAFSLIPGKHRFSLHAIYLEHGGRPVERNEVAPEHFQRWMDWAAELGIGLDFNPTFFSHPKAADGFTLAHRDEGIRRFWVEHAIACRKIGEAFGRRLGTPCVTNVWIPDGMKDVTIDRKRAAGNPQTVVGRTVRPADRSGLQPRRRREQAVRHRLGNLRGRLARVLPGLRDRQQEAA